MFCKTMRLTGITHIADSFSGEVSGFILLQPLFSIDPNGFKTFLDTLPVKSLLKGDMTDAPEAQIFQPFHVL
jgi:hypothetical protein